MGGILESIANYNPTGFALENQQRQANVGQTQANTGDIQAQTAERNQVAALKAQQVKDAEGMRDIFAKYGPGSNTQDVIKEAATKLSGMGFPAFVQQLNGMQKAANELTVQQHTIAEENHQAIGPVLAAIKQAPPEARPALWQAGLTTMRQHLSHDDAPVPDQYPGDTGLDFLIGLHHYTGQVLTQGKTVADTKAAQAKAEQDAADAALKNAQTPGAQAKSELDQRQNDATMLAAAAQKGPDALQAAMDQLPHGRAKAFAGQTDPKEILKVGMTPDQQVTTNLTEQLRLQTAAHEKEMERLGRGHLAVEGAKLKLEQQRAGFDMGGGVSETAKMAAAGQMDPATLRSMIRRSPGLIAQIRQVDPNFDEANIDKRYNTLKEFTNGSVSKPGGQVLALNTMIHHADLYMETAEALKNGNFRPGNEIYNRVAAAFGSAPPTQANLVARFFAGETGKVATGGVPAEGEIKGILGNLGNSNSPDQIKAAGNSLLQLAAGRSTSLIEKAKDAKIDNVVQVIGPSSKEILKRRGLDPETMKPVSSGGSGTIRARDAQGKLHEAPAGTALPAGWKLEQ